MKIRDTMKKYSLASSILLMCCASSLHAQSNVQIFGIIDTFMQYTNTGKGYTPTLDSSGLYGSRWGVKGGEDLGDGLRTDFMLEQGFKADTGQAADPTRIFSRQSWIALSSKLGQVRIGRQNSLMFINESKIDPFYGATMASGLNNFSTYTVRTDKTISYFSPQIGNFLYQTYYGFGDTGGAKSANGNFQAAINYDTEKLHLAGAYQAVRNALNTDTQKVLFAGGNYAFDGFKTFLGYHHAISKLANINKDVLQLAFQFVVTPVSTVSVSYAYVEDHTPLRNNASEVGLMYLYNLSKRTQLYSTLSYLKNTNTGTYTLGGAAVAGLALASPGASARGMQLGIAHFF